MLFLREMGICDLVGCAVKFVDVLNEGELDARGIQSPVAAIRDKKLRTGSGQSGNFHIVGLVRSTPMNRHPAFTIAATEEVGGDLADWNGDRHPLVEGRKDKGLGAAPGTSGHSNALGIDVGQGEKEVESAYAVPSLQAEYFGRSPVVPASFF